MLKKRRIPDSFLLIFALPYFFLTTIKFGAPIEYILYVLQFIGATIGYIYVFKKRRTIFDSPNRYLLVISFLMFFEKMLSAILARHVTLGVFYTFYVNVGFICLLLFYINYWNNFLKITYYWSWFLILATLIVEIFFGEYIIRTSYTAGFWGPGLEGIFGNRNCVAFNLVPLFFLNNLYYKIKEKFLIRINMILLILLSLMTNSSTTLLAICASFIAVFIYRRFKFSSFMILIGYITGMIILMNSQFFEPIISVIANIFGRNVSFTGRFEIWEVAKQLISEGTMWGYGANEQVLIDIVGKGAHNSIISILIQCGILGLILFILFMIKPLYLLDKRRKFDENTTWLMGMLIFYLVESLTEAGVFQAYFYLLIVAIYNMEYIWIPSRSKKEVENQVIPKKIHYCWFGRKSLPEKALRCIESWKKYCPDYEIIEWNEDNYDINNNTYARQAYECKKYAFVSDFARFDIVAKHGGIYVDTDVELIKPIDELLKENAFMGFETAENVAPGLIMGAIPQHKFIKELAEGYATREFQRKDGSLDLSTVVEYTTKKLINYGLKQNNTKQIIADVTIFPKEFFSPKNLYTGKVSIDKKTYSIHHFGGSWLTIEQKIKLRIRGIIGDKNMIRLSRIKNKLFSR